jgi:hypothetical protein
MLSPYAPTKSGNQHAAIRAELAGVDCCSARGVTAQGQAPVLVLCRLLLEIGCDPATPLDAYRGDVLCLQVRSIGEAAALEINAKGTGFVARCSVRTAPPVAAGYSAAGSAPAANAPAQASLRTVRGGVITP